MILISLVDVPVPAASGDKVARRAAAIRASAIELEEAAVAFRKRSADLPDSYQTTHTTLAVKRLAQAAAKYGALAEVARAIADALVDFATDMLRCEADAEALNAEVTRLRRDADASPVWWPLDPVLAHRNAMARLEAARIGLSNYQAVVQCARTLSAISPSNGSAFNIAAILEQLGEMSLDVADTDDLVARRAADQLGVSLKHLEEMEISEELMEQIDDIRSKTPQLGQPLDPASHRIETGWIAWGLINGGEPYTDSDGGPCGHTMVCIVGAHIPTGSDGNAMTLGRSAVFDRPMEPGDERFLPDRKYQFHEYAHVVDQRVAGVEQYLVDYLDEFQLAAATGGDIHDDSLFEVTADLRAHEAMRLATSGEDPYAAMATSIYDAGYRGPRGNIVSFWAADTWDRVIHHEEFTDADRRRDIAKAMGIHPTSLPDFDYFAHSRTQDTQNEH